MAVIRSGGPRRRTAVLAAIGLAAVTVLAGPFMSPAQAIVDDIFDGASQGLEDADTRVGSVAPTAAQLSAVSGLGATARWNRFGTPQSLIRYGGYLATGLSRDPEAAARAFLNRNRAIFRLTTAQISALELVSEQRMAQSDGVAVLLRQRFGDLPAAVDGMVTVGVVGGRVAYASSSLAPTTAAPQAASLSAVDAWLEAAENVGRTVAGGAVTDVVTDARHRVDRLQDRRLYQQTQQARLVALPRPDGSVRTCLRGERGQRQGRHGARVDLLRRRGHRHRARAANQVDHATDNQAFQGSITATDCGPQHPFTVAAGTKQIVVSASAAIATNDIILKLFAPGGGVVGSSDTGTSPEVVTYSPTAGVPPGVYNVQVCPFAEPTVPFTEPGNYAGTFSTSDAAVTAPVPYPPKWKYFLANPPLDNRVHHGQPGDRLLGDPGRRQPDPGLQHSARRAEQPCGSRPWTSTSGPTPRRSRPRAMRPTRPRRGSARSPRVGRSDR